MKNEQSRRTGKPGIFALLSVLVALAVVVPWAGGAQGASFQPVPNQIFGMHWGTGIEDVKKTRTLQLMDTIDEFTMYIDESFHPRELMGATAVGYLFMNDRLGAAFLNLHRSDAVMMFIRMFGTMYGTPTAMIEEPLAIEWESNGNIVQLFIKSGVTFMGNSKIIGMANDVLKKHMGRAPKGGNGPPVVKPGPRTES